MLENKKVSQSKKDETVTHDEFLSANAQALAVFAHLRAQETTNVVKKAKVVVDIQKKVPEPVMDGEAPKLKKDGSMMMTRAAVVLLFGDGTKERFREDSPLYAKSLELSPNASVMLHGRLVPVAESKSGEFGDYAVTQERVVWDDVTVIFDPVKYSPVGVA
jgi:hypothetical protein